MDKNDLAVGARKKLASLGNDQRHTFVASYVRCGYKTFKNHYTPTLLLSHVKYGHHMITDHLWFTYTKSFKKLGHLKPNDKIQFNARVNTYWKGYGSSDTQKMDYDLSYPSKVKLLNHPSHRVPLPSSNKKNAIVVGMAMRENESFYTTNDRPFSEFYVHLWQIWKMKCTLKHFNGTKKLIVWLYFELIKQRWHDYMYHTVAKYWISHGCLINYVNWFKKHPNIKRLFHLRKLPKKSLYKNTITNKLVNHHTLYSRVKGYVHSHDLIDKRYDDYDQD